MDTDKARVCIPGHVIEAMWFLISIFEESGDRKPINQCCDLIRRHLELGWDGEFGGIRLALDVEGRESVCWPKADCKPWWVQVEALVATAYAYLHTSSQWCLDWHEKIRGYAFSHYPQPAGEWTQWLDRYGKKVESAALPVKDPFHLPRGLMYLVDHFDSRIPNNHLHRCLNKLTGPGVGNSIAVDGPKKGRRNHRRVHDKESKKGI